MPMIAEFIDKIADKLTYTNLVTSGILLFTALGSALWVYWRTVEKKSLVDFFEFALPKEIILSPSAKADFLFWITKRFLMPFLLIPSSVVFVSAVAYATNHGLGGLLGIGEPLLGEPGPVVVILFTVSMLLAYDLAYYTYHYAQHKIPLLWELHKVHHSAEVMVGVTKDRVHPLDDLMNRMWNGVIPGICFGIWSLIALNPVELVIFGLNVYVIRNILMMDFLRHTHLKISYGPLNHLFISPHWHQLHHSLDPRHYDKNLGLLFTFWDAMFGTACAPKPNEDFKFGLMDKDHSDYQSLFGLYILPLKKMGIILLRLPGRFWPGANRIPEGEGSSK